MTHHPNNLERITEDITALVDGETTTETVDRLTRNTRGVWITTKQQHTVHHPSLLTQLRQAVVTTTLNNDDTYRAAYASKPSARLDAIATLQRIDQQATAWARHAHIRWQCTLEDKLRGLIGAATNLPHDQLAGRDGLASHTRSWATAARVVSGIEAPAFAPDVHCPNTECEKRGTLRVRFDLRVASCTNCGAYWDPDHVEQLARAVAWAAEHLQGARHWLYDDAGYPVECTECLLTRQAMAERAATRHAANTTRKGA